MSLDSTLLFYIQSIPKDTKEEIIRTINKEPYNGRGSEAKKAKIIFEYLY